MGEHGHIPGCGPCGDDDEVAWGVTTEKHAVEPDTIRTVSLTEAGGQQGGPARSPQTAVALAKRKSSSDIVPVPHFPRQLGPYELLVPIGSGATATVYLARDQIAGGSFRHVAVKLIHADGLANAPGLRTRIEREIRLGGWIRHPHVVSLLDAGKAPEGIYLVLDYVEGATLSSIMRHLLEEERHLPIQLALRLILEVLHGIQAVHDLRADSGLHLDVVHRDVAPQNVLVGTDGVTRLIDLGTAKVPDWTQVTSTRRILGRVEYMSPEQLAGATADRRSDVWSAGVIAWELLAGQRLFPVVSLPAIVARMRLPPPRLRSIRPQIPPDLDRIIASALELDVRLRCPTAGEFHSRLLRSAVRMGCVAGPDDVGQTVREVAGPKLRQRQETIQALLRYRHALTRVEQRAMEALEQDGCTTEVLNRRT